MKVRILHTLAAEGRTSSEVYADELGSALRHIVEDPAAISDVRPVGGKGRYFQRYLKYQWSIRGGNGQINHIVDPGYGHLAFSLDPHRTVVTLHDAILLKLEAGELPGAHRPRFTILGHHLSLAAIHRVARVIVDSECSRADFVRFTDYDPRRIATIPLGVSPIFRPLESSIAGRRDEIRLLHVGHCGFYKNVEGILASIPSISRRLDRPVVFMKAGGDFTPEQQTMIERLGIASQVRHLGRPPTRDLPSVYANADLLLMPSWHEGFGLPVLEAMACGIPVVASNRGSLPEVAGDAAVLVDPQDPHAIGSAVVRVLGDPALRNDLRRRGLERAKTFTWDRTARQTLVVYQAVDQEAAA